MCSLDYRQLVLADTARTVMDLVELESIAGCSDRLAAFVDVVVVVVAVECIERNETMERMKEDIDDERHRE